MTCFIHAARDPWQTLTHNMLSGAGPASPSVSAQSLLGCLSLSVPHAWYLRRLSGCHAFSECLVEDSSLLLSKCM